MPKNREGWVRIVLGPEIFSKLPTIFDLLNDYSRYEIALNARRRDNRHSDTDLRTGWVGTDTDKHRQTDTDDTDRQTDRQTQTD